MKSNLSVTAGIIMGIGLGGFIDGIVFHQILQMHSMLSGVLPQDTLVNVKTSMVWDGLFHLLTWLLTVTGLAVFWKGIRSKKPLLPGIAFFGCMLSGWGLFNVIEGLTNHYILEVHHVSEPDKLSVYDHIFLLSGIIFIIIGWMLVKRTNSPVTTFSAN